MGEPTRPTVRQIRDLYLFVGECCELGADPIAWRRHVTRQLPALFGAQVAIYSEYVVAARPFRDLHWLQPTIMLDFGWPALGDRKPFEEHVQSGRPELGPHVTPDLLQRKQKVFHWSGDLGRAAWRQTYFFNEFVKKTYLDDGLFAHHLWEPGHMGWVFVNRQLGDRPFTRRDRHLMTLLNMELARLHGTKLARLGEPGVSDLPRRLRDVLVSLMEGDNEKQVAARLGISPHTVHEYVRRLYKRFEVTSRSELLARCRPLWPALLAASKPVQ